MKTQVCPAAQRQRCLSLFIWLLAVGIVAVRPQTVCAESLLPTIVRVEEDWELVVITPDANSTAPQVTCTIFPGLDTGSLFATFELNHQSQPAFVPGGVQLLIWDGDYAVDTRKYPQNSVMGASGEHVRWTQTMSLQGGSLIFEIVHGHSTTWGDFGGQGYLRAGVSSGLSSLNGYNPEISVRNSAVGFAANRVASLVLQRVRVVTADGQVYEDETPREVYLAN